MAKTALFRALMQAWQETSFESESSNRSSRRDFLKQGSSTLMAASALGGLQGCTSLATMRRPASSQIDQQVAIIGAGAAGLNAAYYLAKAGFASQIAVYEADAYRIGGRIFTHKKWDTQEDVPDKMFIELGAELVDQGHTHIRTWAKDLGLKVEKFSSGQPGNKKQRPTDEDLFWIDGQTRGLRELSNKLEPLRNLLRQKAALIKSSFPAAQRDKAMIFTHADSQNPVKSAIDKMNIPQFLELAGLDAWVKKVVEIAYTGEMGLDAEEQSAVNLLTLMYTEGKPDHIFYGESDQGSRIQGGNGQIPAGIARSIDTIVKSREAWLKQGHRLTRIEDKGNSFSLTFDTAFGTKTFSASQVVLAIPFTVLRNVAGIENLGLNPLKLASIKNLGYGTNTKIMSGFSSRFWLNRKLVQRSFSGSLFMDQSGGQEFWETSRLQKGQAGIITCFAGGKHGLGLTTQTKDSVIKDLGAWNQHFQNHFSGQQIVANWSQNQNTLGSYICVKPGQYTEFMGTERNPELNNRLFFCGEHTSSERSGYMEGALETGMFAADSILVSRGIKRSA